MCRGSYFPPRRSSSYACYAGLIGPWKGFRLPPKKKPDLCILPCLFATLATHKEIMSYASLSVMALNLERLNNVDNICILHVYLCTLLFTATILVHIMHAMQCRVYISVSSNLCPYLRAPSRALPLVYIYRRLVTSSHINVAD